MYLLIFAISVIKLISITGIGDRFDIFMILIEGYLFLKCDYVMVSNINKRKGTSGSFSC